MILNLIGSHIISKKIGYNKIKKLQFYSLKYSNDKNLCDKLSNKFSFNFNEKIKLNDTNEFLKNILHNNIKLLNVVNKIKTNEHNSLNIIRNYINNLNTIPQIRKSVINQFSLVLNQKLNIKVSKKQEFHQKLIAEVIELLYLSNLIHSNILNLSFSHNTNLKHLFNANNVSILGGDLMLAVCMQIIANIFNNEVSIMITDSVNKMTIGQYTYLTSYNYLIENCNIDTWKNLMHQIYGSNFQNGCKSLAQLVNMPNSIKTFSGKFGINLALALQATVELNQFEEFLKQDNSFVSSKVNRNFDLISAPILLDSNNLPKLVNEINQNKSNQIKPTVDFITIKKYFNIKNPNLAKTKLMINYYTNKALNCLQSISSSECSKPLVDLISSLLHK